MTPLIDLELALHGSFSEAPKPATPEAKRRRAEFRRAFVSMVLPNHELNKLYPSGSLAACDVHPVAAAGVVRFFGTCHHSNATWLCVADYIQAIEARAKEL